MKTTQAEPGILCLRHFDNDTRRLIAEQTQAAPDDPDRIVGKGVRYFGNVADLRPTKVTIYADGSDEYRYKDPSWGWVRVRTWPDESYRTWIGGAA